MKNRKNIVSLFNLVLFLSSFALLSFSGFVNSPDNRSAIHAYKQFCETPVPLADNASQQLSEKNETETESGFELGALSIPFLFSFLQQETVTAFSQPAQAVTQQLTNPIYIAVRNFRI